MLSDQQFERARALALSLAGIELVERHRALLARRSQRVGILDDTRFRLLLHAAQEGDPVARSQFLSLVTTKFTGWIRHPHHFQVAGQHAVEAARRNGRARLWSAAASTGEEPYSIAMALLEAFGVNHPPAIIVATDVDEAAMSLAQRGEFNDRRLRGLESTRRNRFFTPAENALSWSAAAVLRELVQWRVLNLVSPDWPVQGPFDVIFCRNVLMYLECSHRERVLERMASMLAPDGLLMVDPTEHMGKLDGLFTPIAEGVHCLSRFPSAEKAKRQSFGVSCTMS